MPAKGVAACAAHARHAEVGQLGHAARHHDDVGRLEIAVNDAGAVHRPEPAAHLLRDLEGGSQGEAAFFVEELAQGGSGHVLHGEEADAFRLPEVVGADDVGMGDRARELDLAAELLLARASPRPPSPAP